MGWVKALPSILGNIGGTIKMVLTSPWSDREHVSRLKLCLKLGDFFKGGLL